MNKIVFNKPYFSGNEIVYIEQAVRNSKLSGNGPFTLKCQSFFENKYFFKKCLLTTSCTDALEMAAILCDINPGDEVIAPSFTFVSTVNPFILRGAKIVFIDSKKEHPGMNEDDIESLITEKTKAIIPVHYAGFACDMDRIMEIAKKYDLFVIEDAAQAIDGYYYSKDGSKKALGSIGHFSAFSFHETKNITSGEGGMLVINDVNFISRAEIIWEKGTNRSAYYKGEVDKYGWVDIGSSFLMSEINAAFLWAQLENINFIQEKRRKIWQAYNTNLQDWATKNNCMLPYQPDYSSNNAHMFYIIFQSENQRSQFIDKFKNKGIYTAFHYQNLHKSHYYIDKHDGRELVNSDRYSECLVRLPFFVELKVDEVLAIF